MPAVATLFQLPVVISSASLIMMVMMIALHLVGMPLVSSVPLPLSRPADASGCVTLYHTRGRVGCATYSRDGNAWSGALVDVTGTSTDLGKNAGGFSVSGFTALLTKNQAHQNSATTKQKWVPLVSTRAALCASKDESAAIQQWATKKEVPSINMSKGWADEKGEGAGGGTDIVY